MCDEKTEGEKAFLVIRLLVREGDVTRRLRYTHESAVSMLDAQGYSLVS